MRQLGMVSLVGAGPGDPELITLKGVQRLQGAEVVIYDRLVAAELLAYAPPWAELVYAGKAPEGHRHDQGEINACMISYARQGKAVVRLKGGDPFVFGRGGEECLALAEAGIPFEVIPGISSAIAVPAYAGIPVTHRELARSFTVVTGHTVGDDPCGIDWDDLPSQGTLVILMGIRTLPEIARRLVASGRSPETPVAVIQQGTTPEQRIVTGTLADIAEKAVRLSSPAITVVGEVVRLHEKMHWFIPELKALAVFSGVSLSLEE